MVASVLIHVCDQAEILVESGLLETVDAVIVLDVPDNMVIEVRDPQNESTRFVVTFNCAASQWPQDRPTNGGNLQHVPQTTTR